MGTEIRLFTLRTRLLLGLITVATALSLPVSAQAKLYLYAISCNAVVKLDATTAAQVSSLELSTRTTLIPKESPRTAFCDLDAMSFDAARDRATVEVNDRTHKLYRELEFSVPAFRLVGAKVLARKWQDDGETSKAEATPLAPKLPGMLTRGSEAGWLPLATYHPAVDLTSCTAYGQGKALLAEPVGAAGDKVLLVLTCTGGTRLVMVSKRTRRIAPVALPSEALSGRLCFSADNRYVLAQGLGQQRYTKSDSVWLADLQTGKLVKQWQDPRFAVSVFLGYAPGGKLLFQSAGGGFVKVTGLAFLPTPEPDSFFAPF